MSDGYKGIRIQRECTTGWTHTYKFADIDVYHLMTEQYEISHSYVATSCGPMSTFRH